MKPFALPKLVTSPEEIAVRQAADRVLAKAKDLFGADVAVPADKAKAEMDPLVSDLKDAELALMAKREAGEA